MDYLLVMEYFLIMKALGGGKICNEKNNKGIIENSLWIR